MIYNHYSNVIARSPNFYPTGDAIEELAVWVRIPCLPIEYYDNRVLMYNGNRMGETIKVDKNAFFRKGGREIFHIVYSSQSSESFACYVFYQRHTL